MRDRLDNVLGELLREILEPLLAELRLVRSELSKLAGSRSQNPAEEEYGEEALASVVVAERHQSAAAMGKAVFDAVSAFSTGAPQHDDLTLMIIKYAAS